MATTLNPNLLLAIPLAPLAGAAIAGLFGTKFFGTFSIGRARRPHRGSHRHDPRCAAIPPSVSLLVLA